MSTDALAQPYNFSLLKLYLYMVYTFVMVSIGGGKRFHRNEATNLADSRNIEKVFFHFHFNIKFISTTKTPSDKLN